MALESRPPDSSLPPVWLMGLSNSAVGLNSGIAFFVIPQLLAARHVSEATIAGVTAAAMASNFWPFVFGPVLDIWFSRRRYATVFAGLAAALVMVAVMNQDHPSVLAVALASWVIIGRVLRPLSEVTATARRLAYAYLDAFRMRCGTICCSYSA